MSHKMLLKLILQGDKTQALDACARHLLRSPEDIDAQRLLKQAIDLPGQASVDALDEDVQELLHIFGVVIHGPFHAALEVLLYNAKRTQMRRLTWLRWATWHYRDEVQPLLTSLPHWLLNQQRGDQASQSQVRDVTQSLFPFYEPHHCRDHIDWTLACVIVARLNGDVKRAIEWSSALATSHPAHEGVLLETARACRDAARYDIARQHYQTLIELAPETTKNARLELALLCQQQGQLQQSLALYQSVVDMDPEHPLARPQAYFLRCFLTGDLIWRSKLEAYNHARPHDRLSAQLIKRLDRRFTPYIGFWPKPGDRLIQIMNNLRPEHLEPHNLPNSITLHALDAPSARVTFDGFLNKHLPAEHTVELTIEVIQSPDPRVPIGLVEHLLWRYDGTTPISTISPPSDAITAHMIDLATQPYDLNEWMLKGAHIAAQLGVSAIDDLLGIMLHPPSCPVETTPIGQPMTSWRWRQRIQVAAMCILSQIDSGWAHSHRKAILTSMLLGPSDWIVEVAIVIATEIAITEKAAAEDIVNLLHRRLESLHTGDGGYCCYEYALVRQMLRLPSLSTPIYTRLRKRLDELERAS